MRPRVYFLTSYLEYLLERGRGSEEAAVGDASRFCRYLLARVRESDIEEFLRQTTDNAEYRKRLRRSIRRFLRFVHDELGLPTGTFNDSPPHR
ncbi:MAG: hypothetical protein IMX00_06600 [Limnochordales bacterium]|nr:hypothetical protein [Limnochordales bacterium]